MADTNSFSACAYGGTLDNISDRLVDLERTVTSGFKALGEQLVSAGLWQERRGTQLDDVLTRLSKVEGKSEEHEAFINQQKGGLASSVRNTTVLSTVITIVISMVAAWAMFHGK